MGANVSMDEWIVNIPGQSGFEWFDSREAAEAYAVATMTEMLHDSGEGQDDCAWVAVVVSRTEEVVERGESDGMEGLYDYVDSYRMEPTGYTASRLEEQADAVADATAPLRAEIERLRAEIKRLRWPAPNSMWRHFKGGVYRVDYVMDGVVHYVAEHDGGEWTRPVAEWHEHVERPDWNYSGPRFVEVPRD